VKLNWTSYKKFSDGLIELTVLLNGKKEYTFVLPSQQDFDEFERLRQFNPGKAFNFLRKVNKSIKDDV